ncbi:hypothetical protein [Allocoleopsis franciscana]|uniref:Uncharacterized protein n=1 Tax=Allocoleopsis franciscana PCC 7113 TaxID=1173027 RepID=K9WR45_9CYAN|nr:hypothetical protein [Allocoleopsis franciscana]AFZ22254.1 hypothetical protein Mic7113_6690 [Allocoleopsis franciscana PCC 7113]
MCQGRDTQYQSIEGALCDCTIVVNPDERKRKDASRPPPGLTENQGFQPSETGFSGTAGSAEIALQEGILGILTDPNGSRDKAAKWVKETID